MHLTTDEAPLLQMDGRRVIVRLTDAEDGTPRFVELKRPAMSQLARIYELAIAADDALPKPPPPPGSTNELSESQLLAYTGEVNEAMRERNKAMHAPTSPHGAAFLEIVELLSGTRYTMDDADPYFMNPKALRDMLAHWEAPLGGPALADASAQMGNGVAPQPSVQDLSAAAWTVPTAGSPPGTDDSGQPDPAT